MWNDYP
jgi:hypothetical protein